MTRAADNDPPDIDIVPANKGEGAALPSPWRERGRRTAALLVHLAFDLLLVDCVVETWQAGLPLRTTVAGIALLFFVLTGYVLSKGGRIGGRGWLVDPLVPAIVFLAFLVAASWTPEGRVHGLAALGQTAPVLLAGALGVLAAIGTVRLVGPGGARSWGLRIPLALVGAYATASFAHAALVRTPFVALLNGHGVPGMVPWWLQGTWIGAFLLLPIAFFRELGAAIARLAMFPYLRWMVIFAMGCWMALNGLQ